ncbi:hypothetical protein Tco_1232791 [Tanacetum coccineum]
MPDQSDPLGYLQEELRTLNTKVDQLESGISKKVADDIQSSIPLIVVDALKANLPSLLSEALKNTLPQLIPDSIKQSVLESIKEKLPLFVAQEDVMAQLKEMKILADLKAEKEKSEKSWKKILNPATIRAQTQKMVEHEAKRKKILKTLRFSEWMEVHALASNSKGKSIDLLLQSLRAKFEWDQEVESSGNLNQGSSSTTRGTLEAKEMFRKLELIVEAGDDVNQAREIIKDNLDGLGQNMLLNEQSFNELPSSVQPESKKKESTIQYNEDLDDLED